MQEFQRRGLTKAVTPYMRGRQRCAYCGYRIRGTEEEHKAGWHHQNAKRSDAKGNSVRTGPFKK